MKDRIAHIMRAKNLKASDFAALLGIQPSAISHILSGRNQPSLDLVKKIKENFPEYNLDWIVFGSGPITTSQPSLFQPSEPPIELQFDTAATPDINASEPLPETQSDNTPPTTLSLPINNDSPKASSNIRSIVIFYDDGTFENYSPRF